jgi:hypothetical protein
MCVPHLSLRGQHPHVKMRRIYSRMLEKSLVSPAQPRRAGTRLFPRGVLETREAYLAIRARLVRLARKAGLVGSFIFASRARLACLAHDSRTTDEG